MSDKPNPNDGTNFQYGPAPTILIDLVARIRLEPGFTASVVFRERDEDHGRGAAGGWTLIITAWVKDTYHPENTIPIQHFFPVIGATYNEKNWQRWVFDQYVKVRTHECMEFFVVEQEQPYEDDDVCAECPHLPTKHDGRDSSCHGSDDCPSHRYTPKHVRMKDARPFAPNHGPGEDPYTIHDLSTDEERRTQFTGGLDHNRARPEGWTES